MKWYKRDPDAALVGMRGLSHDAKSAYNTILDLLYSRDGNVPDDEHFLCMHIECRPQWWRRVKHELCFTGKIRVIDGKLVANRVETTLKEARNFSETQAKRARKRWVSRKKPNGNNDAPMRAGNANTTTTTYTPPNPQEYKFEESQTYRPTGSSPDRGDDYRSPPRQKSDNELKSIPDKGFT